MPRIVHPKTPVPCTGTKGRFKRKRPLGLGDMVAKIAKPIARLLDRAAGTHLENCSPCAKRQSALNRLVPDVRHPGRSPRQAPQ